MKGGHFGAAGGVIFSLLKDSVNRIFVKIKNYCNVTSTFGGSLGEIFANLQMNTVLNFSTTIDTLNIDCGGSDICGGVITQVSNIKNVKTDIKASLININNNPLSLIAQNTGAIYGRIYSRNTIQDIINKFENNNI